MSNESFLDPSAISGWHAHVYFDAETRDVAWKFREVIQKHIGDKLIKIGRFHEKPVGPHPKWSYELQIAPENFRPVFEWLALNHGQLDLLMHPLTGDDLRDHKVSATWIGHSHPLNFDGLK